jgi:hypothetical protein
MLFQTTGVNYCILQQGDLFENNVSKMITDLFLRIATTALGIIDFIN